MKLKNVYYELNSLDKKTEINEVKENKDASLKKVLEAMKHIVNSEEWEEMEKEIENLTKQEKKEISKFIDNKIKPELNELKENIFDKEKRKELIEKIKDTTKNLIDKIKNMKENNKNKTNNLEFVKTSVQAALLKQAMVS